MVAVPTKQFYVEGIKGKFEVDRKPVEFIGGTTGFQAFWHGTKSQKCQWASGDSRESALQHLVDKIRKGGQS